MVLGLLLLYRKRLYSKVEIALARREQNRYGPKSWSYWEENSKVFVINCTRKKNKNLGDRKCLNILLVSFRTDVN